MCHTSADDLELSNPNIFAKGERKRERESAWSSCAKERGTFRVRTSPAVGSVLSAVKTRSLSLRPALPSPLLDPYENEKKGSAVSLWRSPPLSLSLFYINHRNGASFSFGSSSSK